MRKILTLFLVLISTFSFSQEIKYNALPLGIKVKVNQGEMRKAEKIGDTLYLIKFRYRNELYRGDGFKMSYAEYTGRGTVIGWTLWGIAVMAIITLSIRI